MASNRSCKRKRLLFVGIAAGALVTSCCVALTSVYLAQSENASSPTQSSSAGVYSNAAVASDAADCAEVGRGILSQGGSAVDAAIATTVCGDLHHPQSAGIGGGSVMTVYNETSGKAEVIDFRETAPTASREDMFRANATLSTYGGLSAAIPGMVAGYRDAWRKYGRLAWSALFTKSIEMCESGVALNKMAAAELERFSHVIAHSAPFRDEFFRNGKPLAAGDRIHRRRFCRTLRVIAAEPDSFYNGTLADDIIKDITDEGGVWTADDLRRYTVRTRDAMRFHVGDFTLLTPPPPYLGAVLGYILKILQGYGFTPASLSDKPESVHNTSLTLHRIAESFKWAFAQRALIGDPDFYNASFINELTSTESAERTREKIRDHHTFNDSSHYRGAGGAHDDYGTSHVSAVDNRGLAVSITSTINTEYGSKKMGQRTGIIFNNEMDDFSTSEIAGNYHGLPYSQRNAIKPGKRPVSSMCPSIVLDAVGKIKLVVGASGGPRIVTANAWTILNYLAFGKTIAESVNSPRIHHQLSPNILNYEEGVGQVYRAELRARGHELVMYGKQRPGTVQAIAKQGGEWHAVADHRKQGGTAGF